MKTKNNLEDVMFSIAGICVVVAIVVYLTTGNYDLGGIILAIATMIVLIAFAIAMLKE